MASHPAVSRRRRAHRGGRGGFEPRALVRAREARVVELSTEGRSQRSIATEVGVTQAAVCRILQRADERVLATLHVERVRALARLHRRAEHIYAQAHEGWTRSYGERHRRMQRHTRIGDATAQERTTVAVVSESQAGDPRFLREMLRVLTDVRATFRLDQFDWDAVTRELVRADATRQHDRQPRARRVNDQQRHRKPLEGA